MPHSSVWWVSRVALEAERGVLVEEAVQRVGELVLVALRLRRIATASTGSGGVERLDVDVGAARAEHVAGGGVGELGDRGDVAGGAPRRSAPAPCRASPMSWCSRSSCIVRPLTRVASAFTVPCSTLNRFTCPTYGSTIVLNTNATGGPSPRRAAAGAGPSSAMKCASRSTPISLVALPHSTGNTEPGATPVGERARELVGAGWSRRRGSAPSGRRRRRRCPRSSASWTECSSVSISAGIGPLGAPCRRRSGPRCRRGARSTPRKSASSPIGQLQRRDAGAELLLELVERALRTTRARGRACSRRSRAGCPSSLGHAPHDLGLHLDALDRRHHEDREVGGPQRGGDVAHEVGVARACRSR